MNVSGGRVHRILRDTIITLLAETVVLVTFFVFYRVLLQRYGEEDLGIYALSRRIIAVLIPLVMLGLYEGVGRYIAMVSDEGQKKLVALIGVGVLTLTSVTVVVTLYLLEPDESATYLFGSASHRELVRPFAVFLIGLSFHALAHAVLRGMLQIRLVNILQIVSLGVAPLVILFSLDPDMQMLFLVLGWVHASIAIAVLLVVLLSRKALIPWYDALSSVREIMAYSVTRVPNGVIAASLATVGPYLAASHLSMTEVGYLALAFSLLLGLSSFVSPLGFVLLPHLSEMVGRGQLQVIGDKIHILNGALIQLLLFVCTQFYVFSDYLVTLWMGDAYRDAIPVITIVFLSVFFYGYFVATRSVLDAVSAFPINSVNTLISLLVLLGGVGLFPYMPEEPHGATGYALLFSLSVAVLGVLTYLSLRHVLKSSIREDARHFLWGGVITLVFAVISKALYTPLSVSPVAFVLWEFILFVSYLLILRRLGFFWVHVVLEVIVAASPLAGISRKGKAG